MPVIAGRNDEAISQQKADRLRQRSRRGTAAAPYAKAMLAMTGIIIYDGQ